MKILALEPYNGGSHKAFLDNWSRDSRHEWTILGLPPSKWKWRMRHSAITLSEQVTDLIVKGNYWDVIFCSDMLNLAEFKGLSNKVMRDLPCLAYFHENQLTYPVQVADERDFQFGMTNITTALSANRVWFNSKFHLNEFLEAIPLFLKKMPDFKPLSVVEQIRVKSEIMPQGINELPARGDRKPGPVRILWAARWEFDKNPETFFGAAEILKNKNIDFRISVIGEEFKRRPPVFDEARGMFAEHIDRWGYQETREDYISALLETDVFVSTAIHEFFGVGAVEAISAGAYPLLPRRLAYPEILNLNDSPKMEEHFYGGGADELAAKLIGLADRIENGNLWTGAPDRCRRLVEKYYWKNLAPRLDSALEKIGI